MVTNDEVLHRKRPAKVLAITRMYWRSLSKCLIKFKTEGNSIEVVNFASTADVPHEQVKQDKAGRLHGGQCAMM